VALLVAGLLLLIAVGGIAGGGYYVWRLWQARNVAAEPSAQTQTAETSQTAAPVPVQTATSPAASVSAPSTQPAPKTPPPASPSTSQAPPAARPAPVERAPAPAPSAAPPPVPTPPHPREQRVPGPAASEPAAPAPAPREPEPEEAPEAPAADQTMRTGLKVSFQVTPPDAFVLVDGIVLGRAEELSGQKGARTYSFPYAGTHLVKIRKEGMKELRIAVEAGAGGSSTISAHLKPMAAADIDASDLETFRVREGVALNVRPRNARVLVDGRPMGEAWRYAGGLLHPREILRLDPGKHRLSFVAPGYAQKDVVVEVTEAADKQRQRVEVDLTGGGNGG
jgi:outer membrane biosynthesis protein TonB